MKIWVDLLTPKQLLFFKPMIDRLSKNNQILCTSRNYREVNKLANSKKMKITFVGKHGGVDIFDKLSSSVNRIQGLLKIVKKFSPNLTISFCSPEASRISYGLGIKHIAFSDSPHAIAVMRLSLPFVDKLLVPWIIPKKEFTKFGILEKNILHYKAIDAYVIVKQKSKTSNKINFRQKGKKTILIRVNELQAAYFRQEKDLVTSILNEISNELKNNNVIVLGRYVSEIKKLQRKFGTKIRVLNQVVDGKILLEQTDVFIGSGGTMTAEAALLGIPTISFNSVPNYIEKFLVRKKLVTRVQNPKKIVKMITNLLRTKKNTKNKARRVLNSMEDPFSTLMFAVKLIKK